MRVLVPVAGLVLFLSSPLLSQCSDAGACSIGPRTLEPGHSVSAHYTFGSSGSPDDLTVHTVDVSGSFRILENSRLSVKLPYSAQSGPLGSVQGIGDVTILWDQLVFPDEPFTVRITAGGKIATGSVKNGNLPQAYQSGLGTNDVLVGVSVERNLWNASIAYQISRGRSDNPRDRLRRGDDMLLRAGYAVQFDAWNAGAEVLLIRRLRESSILDSVLGQPESFVNIRGSDQTQINLLARAGLPVSESIELRAVTAIPLLQRKNNIDGLKRALTLSAGLAYSF